MQIRLYFQQFVKSGRSGIVTFYHQMSLNFNNSCNTFAELLFEAQFDFKIYNWNIVESSIEHHNPNP
jgi:hypothetical protein